MIQLLPSACRILRSARAKIHLHNDENQQCKTYNNGNQLINSTGDAQKYKINTTRTRLNRCEGTVTSVEMQRNPPDPKSQLYQYPNQEMHIAGQKTAQTKLKDDSSYIKC